MLRLNVEAHPGSRNERLEFLGDANLGVWVRARPVDGQANAAIEQAIAAALGLRLRQVKLVSGVAARHKIVEIDLPGLQALRSRLLANGIQTD